MTATLCVDAGTTLIKAVVFDEEGRELTVSRRATTVNSPSPGLAEQDMGAVWGAVVEAVRDAASASPLPISRVAITAQGDGAWMIDAHGDPVGPAMLWNDARARSVVDRWRDDGALDELFRIDGALGNMGLPNAILASLLDADPAALDRVASVLTCGSWLFLRLTGRVGLHVSEASAPWLDVAAGTYSSRVLELSGLTAHRGVIPPLLDDSDIVEGLPPSTASLLGLPPGIPVVLAPYDVVATAAGGGTVDPGAAFCILGTTLCTGVVTSSADTTGEPSGLTLRTSSVGPFIRAYPTLAGTGVVDWMARTLGLTDAAAVVSLAASAPAGAEGLAVWPYLSPAGERAPFLDADARGVIAGLSFDHGRAHLARATIEGLAHVVRDCLDASGVATTELAVSGGGSASDLWCSTIADVCGVTTVRAADSQIGAKGAMVYASVATGEFPTVAEAASALVRRADSFEPDVATRELHAARHEDFLASRDAFSTRWSTWAGVASAGADRAAPERAAEPARPAEGSRG